MTPQAARLGIAEHHLSVGEHIEATDLDDAARTAGSGYVERGDEISQQVIHGDGLDARVDPLWADHHRQTLGEIADHLERDAAGAYDHRRAELGDGHAGLAQSLARLLPRAQVLREVGGGIAEPAEIDQVAHAGL